MQDIVVENITKIYKNKTAGFLFGESGHNKKVLENVSFNARRGERVSFVGRNGSGKSTLLRILAGIDRPEEGKIFYFGTEMTDKSVYRKGKFSELCGYVPQDNPLIEKLTVKENLMFWAGKTVQNDTFERIFQLADIRNAKVGTLSGGQKRRVSIACAVINHPPILILDEPSAALDRILKTEIHSFINDEKPVLRAFHTLVSI